MTAPRLYKARDKHGKVSVYQVSELVPVPDRVTHAWLQAHATRVAVLLYGRDWSYKDPATGTWATAERPDFDRMGEVGR